jgi:hypothetical protein
MHKIAIPDAKEQFEVLLNRMEHYREVFQLDDLEPNRAVYNAYLNALGKSKQPGAAKKAEEILTMMETSPDLCLAPDIVTYSMFIDCLTKCGGNSDERATDILRFIEASFCSGEQSLKPNAVFYSAILQA